jgi:hypothetical protein
VINLESLDGRGSNLVMNVTVRRNNDILSVVMEDMLPSKSLWNASILAYGCKADNHSTVTELSKSTLNVKLYYQILLTTLIIRYS